VMHEPGRAIHSCYKRAALCAALCRWRTTSRGRARRSAAAEPSTWAGIAAIVYGVGGIGKINEVPGLAEAAGQAAEVAAGGGGWLGAVLAFAAGAGAVFLPEASGKEVACRGFPRPLRARLRRRGPVKGQGASIATCLRS